MTSATTSTPLPVAELADIQGLIVRGYNLVSVRHFVLTIGDVTAALAFLRSLVDGTGPLAVTSASPWPDGKKPDYALNIGLTASGLQALNLPSSVSFGTVPGNFSSFLQGAVAMADKVGDSGANDPETWVEKLNAANASSAHILLSLYTPSASVRDAQSITLRAMFAPVLPSSGTDASVYELDVDVFLDPLPDGRVEHKIHFGYTDGISNPRIDVEGVPPLRPKELPYVEPWRFIMRDDAAEYTPPAPAALGINGSFSAFRVLEQDVAAFDKFLADEGRSSEEQEFLASKLCGRWRNGNPVVQQPDTQGDVLPTNELTDFDYGTDVVGEPCPFSSHTRRANPRGGPGVAGDTKTSHRIMRRANPYGPQWTGQDDGKARGLAGHFICASLANQFEFIMGAWVDTANFSSAGDTGMDPLLGHTVGTADFPYIKNRNKVEVPGMTQFVTTRGGLYCFLPSLTALAWIANNGNDARPWKIPMS